MGTLKAKMLDGSWAVVAAQGPPGVSPPVVDVVWAGTDAPTDPNTELWYDTDEVPTTIAALGSYVANSPSQSATSGVELTLTGLTQNSASGAAFASIINSNTIRLTAGTYTVQMNAQISTLQGANRSYMGCYNLTAGYWIGRNTFGPEDIGNLSVLVISPSALVDLQFRIYLTTGGTNSGAVRIVKLS